MGAGRSGSTPAVQGLHRSHPPKTRGSGLPREPSTLRQLPSPEGPQQTPPPATRLSSTPSLGPRPLTVTPNPDRTRSPGSLGPRPLPVSWPPSSPLSGRSWDSRVPLLPRTQAVLGAYSQVTRSSDQVVASHPGSSTPSPPGPRPLPSPEGFYSSPAAAQCPRPKQRDVPRDLQTRNTRVRPQPISPTRTPPRGTGPFSHQPSQRELAAAAAAAAALAPARPGPQSKAPSSGLCLPSTEVEFPPRDGPQTPSPRYRHSPDAAPNQLQRHCLYLGRQ